MRRLLLTLILAGTPFLAHGAEAPRPGYVDRRVQSVAYNPEQVVLIRGVLGYQLMLEFAADERLESVSIGDSQGWQVTPNRRANILFLKPIDRSATNMNVVTSQRRYAFDLRVAPKGASTANLPYVVHFIYPPVAMAVQVPTPPDPPPQMVNSAYVVAGSGENAPAQIFDDGRHTYFAWAPQAAVPAIFAVTADGSEALVNSGMRDGYTVVDQLAGRFVLRNGKQVTTVVNQAFRVASPIRAAAR